MGGYGNSELHHRQGRVADLGSRGGSALGMGAGLESDGDAEVGVHHRWRLLAYLAVFLLLGVLLAYTPWLPGLGLFMITAAVVGAIPVTLHAWMG